MHASWQEGGLTPSEGVSTLTANTRSSPSSTPEASCSRSGNRRSGTSWSSTPTVREIGERVGLASPSTVHAHLANLERAGLLRRDPTKPRALELIGRERREAEKPAAEQLDAVRLPVVGEIAAGGPLLAEQNIEDYLAMPSSTKGDFLLRVKGDSMIEAGILDGDLV